MKRMDNWDRINTWHLVLPPSRPSAYHLSSIRDIIRHLPRREPIAVLGSTPETRDLAHELGFEEIYVIDRNRKFYDQMQQLRIYDNREHFVHGDWFDVLPQFVGVFHLVLSDLTIGNIPYEARSQFYALVSNALCSHGLFVDKVLTHPGGLIPLDNLEKKYLQLPVNLLHVNFFSCEFFFCSELLALKHVVDSSLFYRTLKRRFHAPRLLAFLKDCELITPPGCIWYYGRPWSAVARNYCTSLKRVAQYDEELASPYYKRLKIIALEKS